MPLPNKEYTFYTIPLPRGYRRLSRRTRVTMELGVGVAVLILFAIAVSMQMPLWLQIVGWAFFVVYWVGWCAIALPKWWRRRVLRGR
jgi:hypothetical protein